MSIRHLIANGLGFGPVAFVITDGLGPYAVAAAGAGQAGVYGGGAPADSGGSRRKPAILAGDEDAAELAREWRREDAKPPRRKARRVKSDSIPHQERLENEPDPAALQAAADLLALADLTAAVRPVRTKRTKARPAELGPLFAGLEPRLEPLFASLDPVQVAEAAAQAEAEAQQQRGINDALALLLMAA